MTDWQLKVNLLPSFRNRSSTNCEIWIDNGIFSMDEKRLVREGNELTIGVQIERTVSSSFSVVVINLRLV